MSYVLLGCRCLLALVFLISVAGRLRGRKPYGDFVATARRLAPEWMTARMPVVVPAGLVACEVAVPVLLTMPGTTLPGFALAGVLTSGYALAIGGTLRPAAGVPAARPAAEHLSGPRLGSTGGVLGWGAVAVTEHLPQAGERPEAVGELHRGHVIRNVLLTAVAGVGTLAGITAAGPISVDAAAGVVVGSGIVATLIVAADRIVDLVRPLT